MASSSSGVSSPSKDKKKSGITRSASKALKNFLTSKPEKGASSDSTTLPQTPKEVQKDRSEVSSPPMEKHAVNPNSGALEHRRKSESKKASKKEKKQPTNPISPIPERVQASKSNLHDSTDLMLEKASERPPSNRILITFESYEQLDKLLVESIGKIETASKMEEEASNTVKEGEDILMQIVKILRSKSPNSDEDERSKGVRERLQKGIQLVKEVRLRNKGNDFLKALWDRADDAERRERESAQEIASLQNQIAVLSANAAASPAEDEKESQRDSEAQRLRAEFDELRDAMKSLQAELAAKNVEISGKNSELTAKNAELSAKNTELAQKNAEIAAKNVEFAAKPERSASVTARDFVEVGCQTDVLEAVNRSDQIEDMRQKNEEISKENRRLEWEIKEQAQAQRQLQKNHSESIQNLENQLLETEKSYQSVIKDMKTKNEIAITSLKEENATLQARLDFMSTSRHSTPESSVIYEPHEGTEDRTEGKTADLDLMLKEQEIKKREREERRKRREEQLQRDLEEVARSSEERRKRLQSGRSKDELNHS